MKKENQCTSCGANNDLLFSSCVFCNSPLEKVDMNYISDQDLIMNLGEWIGKLEGIDIKLGITISTNISTGINKRLGLNNTKKISYSEVCGNIEKYLGILKVRSNNNANILFTVQDLEKKYLQLKKEAEKNKIKKFIPFIAILFICFLSFIYLAISPGADDEHENLRNIETQIENAIIEKKYDKASLLVEKLYWTYEPQAHEKDVEIYNQKREKFKAIIDDKKENK